MALEYSRPPESLAIELREVARDANALIEVLNGGFNYPLPREFPKDQLIDVCRSLVQLPDGTAEGCRAALDYARNRLPAIRREYILSQEFSARTDTRPALTRGENFDVRLGTLISSVTTALDEYRRLAAEEAVGDSKAEASVVPPEGTIADATVEASKLDSNIAGAQTTIDEVARPESKPADDLRRQLGDARGLNRLAFAEIKMPRVLVSWLRKSVDALKEYPEVIRKTANGLRIGTDIVGIGLDRWHEIERDLGRFVIDQMRRTWDALDEVADLLETRRRKGSAPIQSPEAFDLDTVRRMILEGRTLPRSWWPFIYELKFSRDVGLQSVAPVANLTNLRSLDLSHTQVSDVSALAKLTNLLSLDLRETRVSDVSALAKLTNLQSLDLRETRVSDVTVLGRLANLQSLYLGVTQVSDVVVLGRLINLQELDLRDTQVSDVSALAKLTNLHSLDLRETRVSDVAALGKLANLQSLNLAATQVSDVAALGRLKYLKSLDLRDTQVSDVAALGRLNNLRDLDLRGTQVSDASGLRGLSDLQSLNLARTPLSDVAALDWLYNLKSLDLRDTQVSDVAALAGLTKLRSLDLRGTQVKDVAVLKQISGLTVLRHNPKKTPPGPRSPGHRK